MEHDPHDLIDARAGDSASTGPAASALDPIRRTWLLALDHPDARPGFERAVRDFTVACRRNGATVERVIIAVKQELAHAPPPHDRQQAGLLIDFAVRTCIEQYYQPSTSEFPAT